nr:UDP-glucose 4-epimerase GalE [uncultured Sediminibacterium sp.]
MSKVLVTGGMGFIGSHTVVELIQSGYEPVIADDLSNAELFILDNIQTITGKRPAFYEIDVADTNSLSHVFQKEKNITQVIHFAAFKAVGESYHQPLKYFRNNLLSLINLLEVMSSHGCKRIVFSSSATVYGDPDEVPVKETATIKKALSSYGSTKQMGEDILDKVVQAGGLNAIALRYFNPVGAHESGLLGELPKGIPNNLMPYITQVAAGIREQLTVFGDDYDTPDGTCIRDYIHVVDLAKAHVAACNRLAALSLSDSYEVFNIATGNGVSVKELIECFETSNDIKLNYAIGARRMGDTPVLFADPTNANQVLQWQATLGIEAMVTSAWNWQKNITTQL